MQKDRANRIIELEIMNMKRRIDKKLIIAIVALVIAIIACAMAVFDLFSLFMTTKPMEGSLQINKQTVSFFPEGHTKKDANHYKAYLFNRKNGECLDVDYDKKKVSFEDLNPGDTYLIKVTECNNQGGHIEEYDDVSCMLAVTPLSTAVPIYTDSQKVRKRLDKEVLSREAEEQYFYHPVESEREDFIKDSLLVDNEASAIAYLWFADESQNKYGEPITINGVPYKKFVYEYEYEYSKAKQEKYLKKVDSLAGKLKGDAEKKVRTLDTYMIENCSYDHSLTRFDPYQLLVEGNAVCDGYARGAYFVLNKAGVPCEYVWGRGNGGGGWETHAWNMVKIDGRWYYCDFTWDSSLGTREYLLKGSNNKKFTDSHVPEKEYTTEKWKKEHPVATEDL